MRLLILLPISNPRPGSLSRYILKTCRRQSGVPCRVSPYLQSRGYPQLLVSYAEAGRKSSLCDYMALFLDHDGSKGLEESPEENYCV